MTVFRTTHIIMVAIMIMAAAITYKVKYDALKRYAEVRRIERQINAEKDTIALLKAEWAMMTTPTRMMRLAEQYKSELNLATIEPRQIVKANDIPERLPDEIQKLIMNSEELLAGELDGKRDMINTGSVKP
ncbi:hypothetical protein N5853_04435 [Bartonella sp. HY329]|uniref:cell division protein FtsL n=1 Tax=unclassified Bartonella TaxID=2645622 RepID=UPI0021C6992C|nr:MULTISPECIES: hypothetical protein [unclassified Bartonella]UXM95877.1 hypothetical protein N5853_04435 [Bartonella sp. HY329]UXN10202.1 hypothetical protein N5852_04445 [Bartonella sp. HY328]